MFSKLALKLVYLGLAKNFLLFKMNVIKFIILDNAIQIILFGVK